MRPDDVCPRPVESPPSPTIPHAEPIALATVYRCADPTQADALLGDLSQGYVYVRDHHPNGDAFAAKCRELHGADWAFPCASGMSAIAAVVLSQLAAGDHVVISNQLYGRTLQLLTSEIGRLGLAATIVDAQDLAAVAAALRPTTKLVVVETITNPLLHVSDIAALAELAQQRGAHLLVDNTFASPLVCQPLRLGADVVIESVTKIMNGHSDVLLGLVCGRAASAERVPLVLTAWGLGASPFDCWLASRGLMTLALRVERASDNALAAAKYLSEQPAVSEVRYPGLESHPDHGLAERQFSGRYGSMIAFTLRGGTAAATRFIKSAKRIPFCPSLGELNTTLSHPQSTSHRLMSEPQRQALGIDGGAIRLSVGIESPEHVVEALAEGLAGL